MNVGDKFQLSREEFQQQLEIGSVICNVREYDHAKEQGREPICYQVYFDHDYNRKMLYQIGTYGASGDYLRDESYFLGIKEDLWKYRKECRGW